MWTGRLIGRRMAGLAMVSAVIMLAGATASIAGEKAVEAEAGAEVMVEDTYPMDTCVVSGGKLGSMGDPVVYEHQGREIRFCCAGCIKPFESDPEKYLKILDDAIIERDLPDYPLEVGLVTGKSLMDEKVTPVNIVYEERLVRFHNEDAVKTFMKDPDKYMKKLDEAAEAKAAKAKAAKAADMSAEEKAAEGHDGHSNCGGH